MQEVMEEGEEVNHEELIIWATLRWQSLRFKVKTILSCIWSGRVRLNMTIYDQVKVK